ncbi:MAG: class I SAM-dependent methyltransferase [Gaiellales bacterium]|nr:MAG: class I SAM-dependent methyltransferase [Gaiellales bacterium]
MNAAEKRGSIAQERDDILDASAYDAWFETPLGRLCRELEEEAIFRLADVRPREVALDVGCGTGNYSLEMARRGARVVAVDRSAGMLCAARGKALREGLPIAFHRASADSLPLSSGSFDLIVCITVLCFAERPDMILREAHRLLKATGRLVIGELNRSSYWALLRRARAAFHDSSYGSARFLSPGELKKLLGQAGFEVQESETHIFFPPANRPTLLKRYRQFEGAGKHLAPGHGAFMAMKAVRQPS